MTTRFIFDRHLVTTPAIFESLPIVERPDSAIAGKVCKTVIDIDGQPKWHATEWVFKSGAAFCVASPIEVRRYVPESA